MTAAADTPLGKLPKTLPCRQQPDARLFSETPNLAGAKAEARKQTLGDKRVFSTRTKLMPSTDGL